MKNTKSGGPWKIPGLAARASELIQGGVLLEKNGLESLARKLNEKFGPALKKKSMKLTPKMVEKRLILLVWTKDRLGLVKKFVAKSWDLADLYQNLSYLPKEVIERKTRELRGHSVPKASDYSDAGLGRLTTKEEVAKADPRGVKLPEGTVVEPFVIPVKDAGSWQLMIVNGLHFGLIYNRLLNENVFRCALREAAQKGDDAVVVTGGLMFLDVKKSQGHLTTHRALLSSVDFDPEVIDPDYREKAKIIRQQLPPDEVSYETLRERFLNLLYGFKKIVTNPDGKPVFPGKIYITLGLVEEELIEAGAHAEILYITTVKRLEVEAERKAAEVLWRHALEEKHTELAEELRKKVQLLLKEEKRMIQTNVSHEDRKRFVNIVRARVIKWYEENIPNCRVIAQGSTFVKAGDQTIEIHQVRGTSPSDGFLDEFLKKNAGRRSLDKSLPDVVLLANPFNVSQRWAVAERMGPQGRTSTHIIQLPVALDKEFLREQLKHLVRKASPIETLLRNDQFEPGVARLIYRHGLRNQELLSIGELKRVFAERKTNGKNHNPYIYYFIHTDDHTGHPWKEFYFDAQNNRWLGHVPAVMEILRRGYSKEGELVPIHGYALLDDGVQGHHFKTQAQLHQQVLPYAAIEEEFNDTRKSIEGGVTPKKALELLKEMQQRALEQIRYRGEHWPQTQVQEFITRILEPNMDFFAEVLKRGLAGKVRFVGVSEALGKQFDSRDLAPICFGSGNHFGKTVDDELTEGFIYAEKVLTALRADPAFAKVDLRQLVRAPLFGNTAMGLGLLTVGKDGYQWGISLRRDPSRKSGQNGDPLREAAKNVIERGDFPRIFSDRVTLHFSGDIHRFALVKLTNAVLVSCAPGTDTDPYGERGFSPNNVGNLVVGLPKHGPASGPIRLIVFNHDFVRRFLLKPWKIDWDRIFVNPA